MFVKLIWNARSGSLACGCRYATADWAAQGQALRLDLRLYAVTDPRQNERMHRSNVEAVSGAIDGGITVVQLREKDADGGDFLTEAQAVIKIARPRGVWAPSASPAWMLLLSLDSAPMAYSCDGTLSRIGVMS